jgi:hypothetical protein
MAAQPDAQYWQNRWETSDTPWRKNEREETPFERNAKWIVSELHARTGVMSPKLSALRETFEGSTVFVPLCGDTPALGFWAKRVGCRVIGIDVSEASLKSAAKEQFPDREWSEQAPDSNGLKRIELLPTDTHEGPVTLYVGDVFALLSNRTQYLVDVDIVYDRAAMVAIQPDKVPKYAELMRGLLTVHKDDAPSKAELFTADGHRTRKVMFLNTIERQFDMSRSGAPSQQGPPFHIGEDDVLSAFTTATGGTTRYVSPIANTRERFESPNPPPFVEAYYVIIAQSDDHEHPLLDKYNADG